MYRGDIMKEKIHKKLYQSKSGTYVFDFKFKLPSKFNKLTVEEAERINNEFLNPVKSLFILRERNKGVYLHGFKISKRKINEEEVIETARDKFMRAHRAFRKKVQEEKSKKTKKRKL